MSSSDPPSNYGYDTKPLSLATLQDWVHHGISTGPLSGFRIDLEKSFSLSTRPAQWAASPDDSAAKRRLNETHLVLEPKCQISVFDPKRTSVVRTIQITVDIGTVSAWSHFLKQEATRFAQSEQDGKSPNAASVMKALSQNAAQRLFADYSSGPANPELVIQKGLKCSQFSQSDLSLDIVRNYSFGIQQGILSEVKHITLDLTWSADTLKLCFDHKDYRGGSDKSENPDDCPIADLLSLPIDAEIPGETLIPASRAKIRDEGSCTSHVKGSGDERTGVENSDEWGPYCG